jgi:gamma-glutamyltranspeptidase / glutathione hydrolase
MRAMGRRGMVASPHYLATGAGLRTLRHGGSAVDAAIATNAVLAVVTPYMCGIGGDLFALVYDASTDDLVGLNGSGRAPAEATRERMRSLAPGNSIPARGPLPITIPGCVEAWGRLHNRFGRLPFAELLADAIYYAREGFPATAEFSRSIERSADFLHPGTPARETFLPGGEAPREGDVVVQHRLARTLQTVADEGSDAYYEGDVAREIAASVQSIGGLITIQDLAEHDSDWAQPLSIRYRDVTVYELPPNSQGVVALMMLNMLEQLPTAAFERDDDRYVHLLAESARAAYEDRDRYLTDPEHMTVDLDWLLAPERARSSAESIGDTASERAPLASPGDTIYLCTADSDGNLVSLIESNFMGFGSGVMAGETGIMLQNRGHWFSLDAEHVNVIAPRKRTMHTLMPAMAFEHDRPWLVFGTMGGSSQPQIHVQILTRLIDQQMRLDDALAAPRFDGVAGSTEEGRPILQIEPGYPASVEAALRRRGHGVRHVSGLGHAHAIQLLPDRVYIGASDPRTHSLALGY